MPSSFETESAPGPTQDNNAEPQEQLVKSALDLTKEEIDSMLQEGLNKVREVERQAWIDAQSIFIK